MNPTKRSILALWRKNPGWSYSVKDIREALDAKKPHFPKIRELLSAFVAEGELTLRRNQYVRDPLAMDKTAATGRTTAGKTAPAGKTAKAAGAKARGGKHAPGAPRRKNRAGDAQAPSPELARQRTGIFSAHPNGFGFVETPEVTEGVMIPAKYIGGALNGDRVRIEPLPGRGTRREAGSIVEVLERRRSNVRGVLRKENGQWWLTPVSEKLPLIFIVGKDPEEILSADAEKGTAAEITLAEVELTHYPEHHDEAPEGRIVRVFGEKGLTLPAVIDHILHDLDLSEDFSPETRAEMNSLVRRPKDAKAGKAGNTTENGAENTVEISVAIGGKGREDLRHLPFVTIDGEDARDFDDAVCLETLPGGDRRLWVSIADVAAYVKSGTAVDDDAYRKGTSVYLPRRVLPMLPRLLSDDLCSLKPRQPRKVLTCEMTLNPKGVRTAYRVYEAVIESKARLTYNTVQRWFEKEEAGGMTAGVREMLTAMRALAVQLRKMRDARGSVGFVLPEIHIDLNKQGEPKGFRETYPTEATRLIEQFMLEANETVAEHCHGNGLPVLYRVHEPPTKTKLAALAETLWNFNLESSQGALSTPQGLSAVLARAVDHPQREQVELTILKAMNQAQYRARDEGHFALAAEHYCHFTSPIRRYPDLIVHRALKASFRRGKRGQTSPAEAGAELSLRERTAAEAESRVKRLYMVLFMEPKLGESFGATVNGVGEHGLWLRLREFPVNGLLPSASLPGGHRFDRKRGVLVSSARGRNFAIGDRLTVTLARADRLAQQLDFEFVKLGWEEE